MKTNFIFRLQMFRLFIGGELLRLASWIAPIDKKCENEAEWMLISDYGDPTYSCTDCLSSMVEDDIIQIEPIDQFEMCHSIYDCKYECHYAKPYGFVPEAGCPIHD